MAIFAVSVEIGKVNTTTAVKIGRPISASPVAATTLQFKRKGCDERMRPVRNSATPGAAD